MPSKEKPEPEKAAPPLAPPPKAQFEYFCNVCGRTEPSCLQIALDGKLVGEHCRLCYVEWIRKNVPDVQRVVKPEAAPAAPPPPAPAAPASGP